MHDTGIFGSLLCQNGKKANGVMTSRASRCPVLVYYLLEGGVCVCLVLRTYDSVNAMNVRNLDWWELYSM